MTDIDKLTKSIDRFSDAMGKLNKALDRLNISLLRINRVMDGILSDNSDIEGESPPPMEESDGFAS